MSSSSSIQFKWTKPNRPLKRPLATDSPSPPPSPPLAPPVRPSLALEDPPTRLKRLKSEGVVLAEGEKFNQAVLLWDEALEIDPKDAAILEMKAQALMQVTVMV